jgi:hypothetical protein
MSDEKMGTDFDFEILVKMIRDGIEDIGLIAR